MSDTPTPEAVAAALEGVTPGPWSSNTLGEFGPVHDGDDQAFGMICDPVGQCHWPNAADNARFVAWARNNIEALAADRDVQTARADAAEEFLSSIISASPEPLLDLAVWLSRLLDEDKWPTAERHLHGAAKAVTDYKTRAAAAEAKVAALEWFAEISGDEAIATKARVERAISAAITEVQG